MCRLQVAWALHHWTVEDWENIGCSDESLQQHERSNSTIYQPFRLLLLLLLASVSVRYFSSPPSRLLTTNWADATAYTSIVADYVRALIDTWTHLLMAWNRPGDSQKSSIISNLFLKFDNIMLRRSQKAPKAGKFQSNTALLEVELLEMKNEKFAANKICMQLCAPTQFSKALLYWAVSRAEKKSNLVLAMFMKWLNCWVALWSC